LYDLIDRLQSILREHGAKDMTSNQGSGEAIARSTGTAQTLQCCLGVSGTDDFGHETAIPHGSAWIGLRSRDAIDFRDPFSNMAAVYLGGNADKIRQRVQTHILWQ
jgi:hypothetical protein